MSIRTTDRDALPELGSTEAAVQSCVSLIAGMCGQSETIMAYWLDLYWQVRRAYERENAPDTPPVPVVIRKEDLLPVFRELWRVTAQPVLQVTEPKPATEEPAAPAKPSPAHQPNTYSTDAARFKFETRQRLEDLRKNGVTVAMVVDLADGSLNHDQIMSILECKKVPVETYRKLAAALDKLEN